MFEARLTYGTTLKKILESVKDLLRNAVFDCSASGIQLQAMDCTHTVLVFLDLKSSGFDIYRCDRNISMGVNLDSMSKILKGVGDKESVTLKAQGTPDTITIILESPDHNKVSHYEMRLMDLLIDAIEVKFAIKGDIGSGNIKLQDNTSIDKEEESVVINVQNPVSLTFSCRYLNYFTKATPLSSQVQLSLSPDLPLVVEYRITDIGYIRYFLAPKIEDE